MKTLTTKELKGNMNGILNHIKAQDETIRFLRQELVDTYGGEGSIDDKVMYHAREIMKLLVANYDLETVTGSGLESVDIRLFDKEDLLVENICKNLRFERKWKQKDEQEQDDCTECHYQGKTCSGSLTGLCDRT
jgi:isocitrate dehydrogenase kinase/phosphatase